MLNLRDAILATLVYYDAFSYPLTAVEIHKYLINPARLKHNVSGVEAIPMREVLTELDKLVGLQKVKGKNGFFYLSVRGEELYERRMMRDKISTAKWKKLLQFAKWFQGVPYLEALFVGGSLALKNSTEQGDFDVLVITRAGRMYTCRLLLSMLTSLFGIRRTRYEYIAPDKFCFNQYITDNKLAIEYQSIYTAQTYAQLIPVFERKNAVDMFYTHNVWINKYLFHFRPMRRSLRQCVKNSLSMKLIASAGEKILNTRLGNFIEKRAKEYQQKRIRLNPVTHESGGRVIFTDENLEFHPRSIEPAIIAHYNSTLSKMGVFPQEKERDSGIQRT